MNVSIPDSIGQLLDSIDRGEILVLIRIFIAGLMGAALGWERESKGKAAGLRTHILVCMASALYAGVSLLMAATSGDSQDALRAIPAIATGVGFLGAGLIFVNRSQVQVHGLTTAASVWATAALGMTVGFGFWFLSIGAMLLVWLTLGALDWISPHAERARHPEELTGPEKKDAPHRP